MNTILDNVYDQYWINLYHYKNTTQNISVKVWLDSYLEEDLLRHALEKLLLIHPYLSSQLGSVDLGNDVEKLFVLYDLPNMISVNFNKVESEMLKGVMEETSKNRNICFNLSEGELIRITTWSDGKTTILELSVAHLIGDISAVLSILSDLLKSIDNKLQDIVTIESVIQRRGFSSSRYAWGKGEKTRGQLKKLDTRRNSIEEVPLTGFKRYTLPIETIEKAGVWLKENNIDAKPTDLFQYTCATSFDIYTFIVVLSYRSLLKNSNGAYDINTSTVCALMNLEEHKTNKIAEVLEKIYSRRKEMMTNDGVLAWVNHLRTINLSLNCLSINEGSRLLNGLAITDKNVFSLNNFGSIDSYFDNYKKLNIIDLSIQDSAPVQGLRMFGFRDKLHMYPVLRSDNAMTPDEYWIKYSKSLSEKIEN